MLILRVRMVVQIVEQIVRLQKIQIYIIKVEQYEILQYMIV